MNNNNNNNNNIIIIIVSTAYSVLLFSHVSIIYWLSLLFCGYSIHPS